jgi:hypothetical protein
MKGAVHEEVTIHRRTDHRCTEGSRCWNEGPGSLPQARHLGRYVLQVAIEVWRGGRLGGQALEGPGRREPPPEVAGRRPHPRQPGPEAGGLKKVVTPVAKREAAGLIQQELGLSAQRTCTVLGVSRSALQYVPRPDRNTELRARVLERLAVTRRLPAVITVDDHSRESVAIEPDFSLTV